MISNQWLHNFSGRATKDCTSAQRFAPPGPPGLGGNWMTKSPLFALRQAFSAFRYVGVFGSLALLITLVPIRRATHYKPGDALRYA